MVFLVHCEYAYYLERLSLSIFLSHSLMSWEVSFLFFCFFFTFFRMCTTTTIAAIRIIQPLIVFSLKHSLGLDRA